MKLKNIGFATIILLLAVFGFSSCDGDSRDHYFWEKAYVNSALEIRSDGRGYFEGLYDIDVKSDVFDKNHRPIGKYVRDISYHSGDIRIVADDPMPRLTLILYLNGYEKSRIDLERIRMGENEFTGGGVSSFLFEVSQVLRRDGYAEIGYAGLSAMDGRTYMDLDIYMDIDAYMRY